MEEQKVIISSEPEGTVNGLDIGIVRKLTAVLIRTGAMMMRDGGILPEEVASAFVTAAATVATAAYRDVNDASELIHTSAGLLPELYDDKYRTETMARKVAFIVPGPTTPQ